MSGYGWIGVDLDGTLAKYESWVDEMHIGEPIPLMVERIRQWLAEGHEVRIFTARVGPKGKATHTPEQIKQRIREWTKLHIGTALESTCQKDYAMVALWDDRAVQVIPNTGQRADGQP